MDGMRVHSVEEASFNYNNKTSIPLTYSKKEIPLQKSEYTIRTSICCSGVGLHTGRFIRLRFLPAPVGTGVVFRRTDIDNHLIFARYDKIVDTRLSTVLASPTNPDIRISTIEHFMAALSGLEIDNIIIECDGPEIPVLDGSASDYVFLLQCAGRQKLPSQSPILKILKPVRVQDRDAFAELRPSSKPGLLLSLSIEFPASIIGKQHYTMMLTPENFKRQIAHCRTFTFKQEIDTLHKMGLARGGNLDNAIVIEDNTILNPNGLRCADEFVRHKMLDAVGDLALIGSKIHGEFRGHKSGHRINNLLLRQLMQQKDAWCYLSMPSPLTSSFANNPTFYKNYKKQEA